jgi:sterol desaturase/sphingolipid hydroxylase (fatty acid hydroxylase superfamily)
MPFRDDHQYLGNENCHRPVHESVQDDQVHQCIRSRVGHKVNKAEIDIFSPPPQNKAVDGKFDDDGQSKAKQECQGRIFLQIAPELYLYFPPAGIASIWAMPDLHDLIARPFQEFTLLTSRAFGLYFLSYFLMAFVLYKRRKVAGSFADYLFPKDIYARKDFFLDGLYFCFITAFAYAASIWIGGLMPFARLPYVATSIPGYIGVSFAAVILFDFLLFATHYAQHKIGALWRFHALHHAPDRLHFFVAFRHHPVDVMLVSLVLGLEFAVFPQPGTNIFIVLYYLAGYHFRHSHIPLDYPRWLNLILISPSDHQAHHDKSYGQHARNIGFIFSFWDRMAGTYAAQPARPIAKVSN